MHGCSQQALRQDLSHEQRMDRFSNSRISSTVFTNPTAAVVQTPQFNGMKRRRLYGLNSRFDRMLQEVAWASHASTPFVPRRKRAYSSDSSSMANHDLPKTPTEMEYGSTKLGISSVPAIPESWFPEAMSWGKPYLSPSQVGKTGDPAVVESSPKLPEWLNNVLATLPPNNAVRCLTLPPGHSFRKDHVDRKSDPSEEDSVFAFQAPVDGYHPEEHTKTEGQPRVDLETAYGEPVELHGCCPTASPACTVPFSTPGPGWTTSQASASYCQLPSSSPSCISQPTGTGALKVLNTPLPFSTPGPFVSAQPTYGHVLDRCPTAQRGVACDAVLPVVGWGGVTSFPDPRATKIDRLNSYLPSDHGNGDEFLEQCSSFILDDVAGPLPSLESPPAVCFRAPIENLSFSPTTWSAPACSKDKLLATTSPRSLTWGSPTAVTRRSGVADNTGPGRAKPAVFLSDIQLDEKAPYDAFPLTLFSINIESSPDGDHDTESLPNLHRSQMAPTAAPPPVTPPPFPKHLPTYFGWISPDASNAGVFERIESVDEANID